MNKAKLSGLLTSMMVVAVTPSFGEQMVQPMEVRQDSREWLEKAVTKIDLQRMHDLFDGDFSNPMAAPEWITASPVGQSGAYVLSHNRAAGSGDQYEETTRYSGFLFSTYEKSVHDPRVSMDIWIDTNQIEYDPKDPFMAGVLTCMQCSIDPFSPRENEIVGQLQMDVTSVAGDLVLFNGQSVFVTGSFIHLSFLDQDSSCSHEYALFFPEFEAATDLTACENQHLRAWDESRWAASQGRLGDVSEEDVDEAWEDPLCPDWLEPSSLLRKKCHAKRQIDTIAAGNALQAAIAACDSRFSYGEGVKKFAVSAVVWGSACGIGTGGCQAQSKIGFLQRLAARAGVVAGFAVGGCFGVYLERHDFGEDYDQCLEDANLQHGADIRKAATNYTICLMNGHVPPVQ